MIRKIESNKKDYMELLLLGDEQESMIELYLDRGDMYVFEDQGVKAICVVTDEGEGVLEIKNIATDPKYQRRGYAKRLIDFIEAEYSGRYSVLQVGTGESPLTIPFYQKCGFIRSHVIKDFFVKNYDHLIYEDGVLLKDMVYFRKRI